MHFTVSNLRKDKRKTGWADRVQWPSFLQSGASASGCHIGRSVASDFRGKRAVSRGGGQMEGGCTARPSSAVSPLLAHTHTRTHSLTQPLISGCFVVLALVWPIVSLLALTLSLSCTPSHSQIRFLFGFPLPVCFETKEPEDGFCTKCVYHRQM